MHGPAAYVVEQKALENPTRIESVLKTIPLLDIFQDYAGEKKGKGKITLKPYSHNCFIHRQGVEFTKFA